MPTYSVVKKTQARINWNTLITLNFAYWPESISAVMGSVETQEHLPAKPHGPAHTDKQGAACLGHRFWSHPHQMWKEGLECAISPSPLPSTQSAKVGDSQRELVPAGFAFIDILVLFILSRKFVSSITLAGSTSSQGIKHLQIGVFVFF